MAKKKIDMVLKTNHLNLVSSFKNHLEEERKYDNESSLYKSYCYDYYDYDDYDNYYKKLYPFYDEYYDDIRDDYDYFGKKKKKKKYENKHYKYSKKSKARKYDNEYLINDDTYNNKLIYYYRDYLNPEDVEIFECLFDFDTYLSNEGINIPDNEVNNILTRGVSHCCINPKSRLESGKLELISKCSYADLRYACSECEDGVMEINTAYAG